nr:tyrosine-protein phosphatase pmp1 [Quercus suber]
MSMTSSLIVLRQANIALHNTTFTIPEQTNGCLRLEVKMTDHSSPEASLFSPRPHILSLPSSLNMSQTDESMNDLSPASSSASTSAKPHASLSGYPGGYPKFHHHTISDGSNDSSPTTTISTVDDSSATEPSPGSSPESPPPTTFAVGMLRPRTADETGRTFFELQKQPPPRKGRNLKGLAVNTARQPGQKAASTTNLGLAPMEQDVAVGIASPAFVKLPQMPKTKKRPSNLGLTLLTPGNGVKAPPAEIRISIPPTPALSRPTLRHFQSSPSLPAFPNLGMRGARTQIQIPSALQTIISPIEPSKQSGLPEEEEEEQNFDIPLSREEKPEAYPNGPITVYDPNIDLYLEPTAEECRRYDVIMNVANEVRNPFLQYDDPDPTAEGIRVDGGGGIQLAPKRSQLAAVMDENGATPYESSPTTPKATPLNSHFPANAVATKDPEYIHIKWDHNSDIVPDLLRLVRLIDEKVQQQKRVLIHCQCGVSRSASLLVAYGLYKNPSLSVQEAYDAVKQRSKWIGPNMNLIMQLQEFRTSLARGGVLQGNRGMSPITPSSAYREWRGPFSTNPSDPNPRAGPSSAGATPTVQPAPASASAVSPGPSSAPSGLAWPDIGQQMSGAPSTQGAIPIAMQPATAYVDPSGHVVPVLNMTSNLHTPPKLLSLQTTPPALSQDEQEAITPTEALASPRSEHFSMTSLRPSAATDAADRFGLMSPTSTQFSSSPFDRSALLASLGMGSVRGHDEAPRRSLSLKSQTRPQESSSPGLNPPTGRRLRGKVSSPTLREQQELQSLQAKIEASMSLRPRRSLGRLTGGLAHVDEALMSPRATEFTRNPFALSPVLPESASAPQTSHADAASQSLAKHSQVEAVHHTFCSGEFFPFLLRRRKQALLHLRCSFSLLRSAGAEKACSDVQDSQWTVGIGVISHTGVCGDHICAVEEWGGGESEVFAPLLFGSLLPGAHSAYPRVSSVSNSSFSGSFGWCREGRN